METFMLQLHFTWRERHYSSAGKLATKTNYGCMIHGLQVDKSEHTYPWIIYIKCENWQQFQNMLHFTT